MLHPSIKQLEFIHTFKFDKLINFANKTRVCVIKLDIGLGMNLVLMPNGCDT